MIDGVVITPLRQIADERGKVMHMLRSDWRVFREFGEIYFSSVFPGAIKAWHLHKLMTLNYAAPFGMIKFARYDEREISLTRGHIQEVFMGRDNYVLVRVPPLICTGFKGIGIETTFVANCATLRHAAEEIERRDPFDAVIGPDWGPLYG